MSSPVETLWMKPEGRRQGEDLISLSRNLSNAVEALSFSPPVAFVYNPLTYARAPHETYLKRYGSGSKRVLLLGMNPGPWGMVQTGIPFGDVVTVRDWLKIFDEIEAPEAEHEKRPIQGLDCGRVEVSGRRLWSWVEDTFASPEAFFADFLVINYCPLAFLESTGRNRTPDRLPAGEKAALLEVCDQNLRRIVDLLHPELLIGIGRFARLRAEKAIGNHGPAIGEILHPSPASPAANRGWRERAVAQLEELGIVLPPRTRSA